MNAIIAPQAAPDDLITAVNLDVASIEPDPANVRATPLTPAEAAQLQASIAAQGVLSPILVRPYGDNRYRVVFGAQRLAACVALGRDTIPAVIREMSDAEAAAAQAAENMARTSMAPVDQWLAIRRLQEHGFSVLAAGEQLGLSAATTRRLDRLGAMVPEVIDAIRKYGMPSDHHLITIASAPAATQAAAMKAKSAQPHANGMPWYQVANACTQTTISRSVAKFDVAASGIVFEPDLFAADPDEAYTTDVKGFLAAQEAWLEAHIRERAEAGERITMGRSENGYTPKPPAGWEEEYVHVPPGTDPPVYGKRAKRMTVLYISSQQSNLGEIRRMVIKEREKPKRKAKGAAAAGENDPAPVEQARPVVSEKGRGIIAAAKTQALQQYFAENSASGKPRADMTLALLLLALTGSNVQLRGGARGIDYIHRSWLAAELVNEHGFLRADAAEVAPRLAARLLSVLLVAPGPGQYASSGDAADWIGRTCGIGLPRWDTAEFLECVSGDGLRAAATAAGMAKPPGKVSALRAALVGAAETWVPPGAAWSALGLDAEEREDAREELRDLLPDGDDDEAEDAGGEEGEDPKAPAAEPEPPAAAKPKARRRGQKAAEPDTDE